MMNVSSCSTVGGCGSVSKCPVLLVDRAQYLRQPRGVDDGEPAAPTPLQCSMAGLTMVMAAAAAPPRGRRGVYGLQGLALPRTRWHRRSGATGKWPGEAGLRALVKGKRLLLHRRRPLVHDRLAGNRQAERDLLVHVYAPPRSWGPGGQRNAASTAHAMRAVLWKCVLNFFFRCAAMRRQRA